MFNNIYSNHFSDPFVIVILARKVDRRVAEELGIPKKLIIPKLNDREEFQSFLFVCQLIIAVLRSPDDLLSKLSEIFQGTYQTFGRCKDKFFKMLSKCLTLFIP